MRRHNPGFGFIDKVRGGRLVSLADVTVSIGSVAHHAHLTRLRPVSLAATRALKICARSYSRDHALELNQELIFGAAACGTLRNSTSTPWRANSSISRIW